MIYTKAGFDSKMIALETDGEDINIWADLSQEAVWVAEKSKSTLRI